MSTEAQIAANRANAEHSTGPKTEEGKAASSHNRASHGLSYVTTHFFLLPFERSHEYENLLMDLRNEHSPMTRTEDTLVERMAQHQWLRCRAEFFESRCFDEAGNVDEKRLALFIRYRTSHERAFHKLQRAAKTKSRKAQSRNWLRIAEARERGPHPQTGEASNGKGTPHLGDPARRS
jgi:hypothetical protein